jgi:hypothetical protein
VFSTVTHQFAAKLIALFNEIIPFHAVTTNSSTFLTYGSSPEARSRYKSSKCSFFLLRPRISSMEICRAVAKRITFLSRNHQARGVAEAPAGGGPRVRRRGGCSQGGPPPYRHHTGWSRLAEHALPAVDGSARRARRVPRPVDPRCPPYCIRYWLIQFSRRSCLPLVRPTAP